MVKRVFFAVYKTVCRSLFAKDKLLFSVLLSGTLDRVWSLPEWKTFTQLQALSESMTAQEGAAETCAPDQPKWLSAASWAALSDLDALPAFHGIAEHLSAPGGDVL